MKALRNTTGQTSLRIALTLLISLAVAPSVNAAAFYNLGSLDVQPVYREGAQNKSWFVEYLKPGEQLQEKIRISNFSATTKNLDLYGTDNASDNNETVEKNFITRQEGEKNDDVAAWIKLPTEHLTLEPGESKILSVNFALANNAGVGLHKGAIIVRESNPAQSDTELKIEKGVRVYLNVIGPAITNGVITNAEVKSTTRSVSLELSAKNLGTTDFKTVYGIELQPVHGWIGDNQPSATEKLKIKPGENATGTVSVEKPSFGLYNIYATTGKEQSYMGTMLFVPFWMVMLMMLAAVLATKPQWNKYRITLPNTAAIFTTIQTSFNTTELKRSFAYFGIFSVVLLSTFTLSNLDNGILKAQLINSRVANSYNLTIKWGNLRKLKLPENYTRSWDGQFTFNNAQISIQELLNFESTDNAQISENGHALRFNLKTGPDNDGVILHVVPTSDLTPTVLYENYKTHEKITFDITDFLSTPGIFPEKLFSVSVKTDLGAEHVLGKTTGEGEATAEAEATPAPSANIPELENLFVEELPATPETLSDFILTSDYVDKITTERKTAQVETDSILIKALEATPEVLQEVAATPDLNFIFIPTETVSFPAQEFSFDQTKLSTETLGTLIFVQNKDTPWNTYVGTTDFTSLSGNGTIPASSLTIIPGNINVLANEDGATVQTGNARTFSGTFDKSVLVNVGPTTNTDQAFVMNPMLQIRIPPGTLPGRYRGTLTITSL